MANGNANVWKFVVGSMIVATLTVATTVGATMLAIDNRISEKISIEAPYLKDKAIIEDMMMRVRNIEQMVSKQSIDIEVIKSKLDREK